MAEYSVGQQADVDGHTYQYDGEQWVLQPQSTGMDMAKAGAASAVRGAVGIPGDLASNAVGLAGWAGQNIAQNLPWASQDTIINAHHKIGDWTEAAQKYLYPATSEAEIKDIAKDWPGVNYQAEGEPGRIAQSVGGMASQVPLAMAAGGENFLPALGKTVMSGLGSEAGGYLTGDSPVGRMVGALLGWNTLRPNTPPPATKVGGMAKTLEDAGVPLSAAERTGSRLRATLEGGPPKDRSGKISDVLLQGAGINRPAGNTETLSKLVAARSDELEKQADNLKRNTSLPVSNSLWNDLGQIDLQHTAKGTGTATGQATSLINPEVHQAYEDFQKLASGTRSLTGAQYSDLSRKWNASSEPALWKMADRLDADMHKAHPEWAKWNTDYGNLQGIKAASEAAGGTGTTSGIEPSVVRKGIRKPTELKGVAEAAEGLLGPNSYPQPYDVSKLSKTAGAIASGAGFYHGGVTGAGEAGLPFFLGGLDPVVSTLQRVGRSRVGQNLLLDPQNTALALYGQSRGAPEGQVSK